MNEYMLAITTLGNEDDAVSLARALLERRLVACASVLSARSLYRWQGAIQDEGERILFLKTRADRFEELAKAFEELHPYEVPELITLPIARGAAGYLAWLDACLSDTSG